jgi:hypothetical protein
VALLSASSHITLITVLIASSSAFALDWPSQPPERAVLCEFEGFPFAWSPPQTKWTIQTKEDGHYDYLTDKNDSAAVLALVRIYLPVVDGKTTVSKWSLRGSDTRKGPVSKTALHLTVSLSGKTGPLGVFRSTSNYELLCPQLKSPVSPGDVWKCVEAYEVTWDFKPPTGELKTGTETGKWRYSYRYERDEPIPWHNNQTITAAVISRKDKDDHVERNYLDPNLPWCPLRTDHVIVMKSGSGGVERVLGSNVLLRRVVSPEKPRKPDEPSPKAPAPSPFPWTWLAVATGSGILILLGVAIRRRSVKSRKS